MSQSHNQLSSVVPGALRSYDLPNLAAALAPRPLTIRSAVDSVGKPVAKAELEQAYAETVTAYRKQRSEKNLVLAGE